MGSRLLEELKHINKLAAPILIAQLGVVLLNVVDMIMLGHYSAEALSAAALGSLWTFGTLMLGVGVFMGLDPFVSQSFGSRDKERLKDITTNGFALSGFLCVLIALLWAFTRPVLILLGQDPHLAELAHQYALIQIPSLLPFCFYSVCRHVLIGQGLTLPIAISLLVTNALNAGFNWVFIFGKLGIEPMGIAGAGLSTSLMRTGQFLLIVLLTSTLKTLRGSVSFPQKKRISPKLIAAILAVGIPIGIQLTLEAIGFQISTAIAGRVGKDTLAAHAAVLNLTYLSFIFAMSLSIAASTRIGHLIGADNWPAAKQTALGAYLEVTLLCLAVLAAFVLLGSQFASWFNLNPAAATLSTFVFPIAGLFQLFYGIQLLANGIARATGRTLLIALSNIAGLLAIALPLSYWLTLHQSWGISGIWWGLTIGVVFMAIAAVVISSRWLSTKGASV